MGHRHFRPQIYLGEHKPSRKCTHRNVDKGFAPWSRSPNFVQLDIAIRIDMKHWSLAFVFDIDQILGKSLNGLGQRNIASVISADDGLALQVGDKYGRSYHRKRFVRRGKVETKIIA